VLSALECDSEGEMATVFFELVPGKAAKLSFSAVALLSAIVGFYFACYRLPQRSPVVATIKTNSSQPGTVWEKSSVDVLPRREPLADAREQLKFEVFEAERQREVSTARYRLCLSMAQKHFEMTWAAQCKSISEQDKKRHERCIAQVETRSVCAPLARSFSESCALPPELAGRLKKELEEVITRCRPNFGTTSSQ